MPSQQTGAGAPWHALGGLLALDVGFADTRLRRIAGEPPPPPTMATPDREVFTETLPVLDAATLSDAWRDEVAARLRRGRERVAMLTAAGVGQLARDTGMSEWRAAALAWSVEWDAASVGRMLSLGELFDLGGAGESEAPNGEGWGLLQESTLGCLCALRLAKRPWEDFAGHAATPLAASRFADLMLRVVEALAELGLPASLAPAVLEVATLEFLDRAQPAGQDDWRALVAYVQSLPRGRVEDYVATLTATGPLVPAQRR